ncbi:SGNH/GDSL hydrolase family protein [Tsukamurella spumae]|uniref:SGNH/GDSL hydrolase family protein n=1 Tax=Tsukamurella spumae TaxID=44753 RepID=A0A846WVL8_9ACTN|nr:SGNH/GDSL hydrolase family protein [Tsukamurella spumae]NKY17063.1 SGNH/GDSL hydrolase family protein [Tsukamurella spumae]
MLALRNRRHLRRFGYGVALGAGIAIAPFAIAAASADAGPGHGGGVNTTGAQPVAAQGIAHAQQAKPVALAKPAVRVAPRVAPAGGSSAPRIQAAVDRRPVVVIGASVSAGKEVPSVDAYPRQVRAISGRPVLVSARSGAGYADGSMAQLTRAADLPRANPSLVVLQAGTNDVGASPGVVAGQVRQVVSTVRRQAPGAKIAVVTVFPSIHNGAAARSTDAAIIGAARAVDPSVAVISPLNEGWTYRAAADGHPGIAAHERLAERVSALA